MASDASCGGDTWQLRNADAQTYPYTSMTGDPCVFAEAGWQKRPDASTESSQPSDLAAAHTINSIRMGPLSNRGFC